MTNENQVNKNVEYVINYGEYWPNGRIIGVSPFTPPQSLLERLTSTDGVKIVDDKYTDAPYIFVTLTREAYDAVKKFKEVTGIERDMLSKLLRKYG